MNNQNQEMQKIFYTYRDFINEIQIKIAQENDDKKIDTANLTSVKKNEIRHIAGTWATYIFLNEIIISLIYLFAKVPTIFLALSFVIPILYLINYYIKIAKKLNYKTKYANIMSKNYFYSLAIRIIIQNIVLIIACEYMSFHFKYIESIYSYVFNFLGYKQYIYEKNLTNLSIHHINAILILIVILYSVFAYIFNKKSDNKQEIEIKKAKENLKNIKDENEIINTEIAAGLIQSQAADVYNTLATGSTGSGKTQLMNRFILNRMKFQNHRFIIFDVKGDTLQTYMKQDKDVLFDITDKRSVCWNFLEEAEDPAQLKQMSYSLIPPILGDTNPFFRNSSREKLYNELLKIWAAGEKTNADFLNALTNINLENENEDVRRTFQEAISNLLFVNTTGKPFNLKKWLRNANNTQNYNLFVAVNSEYADIQKPFLTLFLSVINSMITSKTFENKNRINIMIDEFNNVGKINALDTALSLCREKNIAYFIFNQSFKNIENIYKNEFSNLMDNISNRYTFRAKDVESAELLSKSYGKHETHEILSSQTQAGQGQSLSQSENIRDVFNVKTEEITKLSNLSFVASFLIKAGNTFIENFVKLHTLSYIPLNRNLKISIFEKREDWDKLIEITKKNQENQNNQENQVKSDNKQENENARNIKTL